MEAIFPVGTSFVQSIPLERFLPPLEEGVVARLLAEHLPTGGRVFDPFGSSPHLALECARAGCDVTLAVNNPVTRFVMRHMLQPFGVAELQSALAHLAAIPKDGTRLELFIMDLYRSRCARCGETVEVEFFVWDKELGGPSHKVYACERCSHAGESVTTEEDWGSALDYSRSSMHVALALDGVAPPGDPDRKHAEAALSVYPGRAIFALITIVNKLAQTRLDGRMRAAAQALLLTAFDAANALWSHPEGRTRPRQLIASARYREVNVWRALERAVDLWAMPDEPVEVRDWDPIGTGGPGTVTLFPGPARDLCRDDERMKTVDLILSIPPRPNQAYWTLSALWTAWLWGREAAAPIKVALRRRRYDWGWHATALRTVLRGVAACYPQDGPVAFYVPEAEPGFVAATMAGVEGSGFRLTGRALRSDEQQLITLWVHDPVAGDDPRPGVKDSDLKRAMETLVARRAEPAPYAVLHAEAWTHLTQGRLLEQDWGTPQRHPVQTIGDQIDRVLQRTPFEHLSRSSEPESGVYSLPRTAITQEPLSDRVERQVLELLRERGGVGSRDLDQELCDRFRGLLTPDRRWVLACLRSYAERRADVDEWVLRPEDEPEPRRADCEEMHTLLVQLGERLGFDVGAGERVTWQGMGDGEAFTFEIRETAAWGPPPLSPPQAGLTFVIPGSRSGLIAERARRDPGFRAWLEAGLRVMKFRHVRRLTAETTLTTENLAQRLAIDPPEHEDPQLPLL